jgi:SAM-dependent methyltransferase
MTATQTQIFAAGEGDRWFVRNRGEGYAPDADADFPLSLIELFNLNPQSVLEIGASNAARLACVAERYGSSVVAVEPSGQAIADGLDRFPGVEFIQATADAIPTDRTFDLVIVNFVFHWVGRPELLRAVAEVDRLLADGGHLIIGDFFPDAPTKVRYHHLPKQEVFTYKQNYAAIFLATGMYVQVGMLGGDHALPGQPTTAEPNDRIATWLLQKRTEGGYAELSFHPA